MSTPFVSSSPAPHDAAVIAPFTQLGLPLALSLDPAVLEAAFLKRQLALHPDQFVSDPVKQAESEAAFSHVVEAYETLKEIKTRAKLLFQYHGLWPLRQDPDTLEALMEAEEACQEGRLDEPALTCAITEAEQTLCKAFDAQQFERAGAAYMRMRGLWRLREMLKQTLIPPSIPSSTKETP